MDKEQANEIEENHHKYGSWEIQRAKGYLEGYAEAKRDFKILIDALDGETYKDTGCWCRTKGDERHSLCLVVQGALSEFMEGK